MSEDEKFSGKIKLTRLKGFFETIRSSLSGKGDCILNIDSKKVFVKQFTEDVTKSINIEIPKDDFEPHGYYFINEGISLELDYSAVIRIMQTIPDQKDKNEFITIKVMMLKEHAKLIIKCLNSEIFFRLSFIDQDKHKKQKDKIDSLNDLTTSKVKLYGIKFKDKNQLRKIINQIDPAFYKVKIIKPKDAQYIIFESESSPRFPYKIKCKISYLDENIEIIPSENIDDLSIVFNCNIFLQELKTKHESCTLYLANNTPMKIVKSSIKIPESSNFIAPIDDEGENDENE